MDNKVSIETLVKLAFNYGPFFFSIILIFYLWMKSKKNYTEICIRTDPKPFKDEINTHRRIYMATSLLTALFIIFCSGLWLVFKLIDNEYVYHFKLVDISEFEVLSPRGDPIFIMKNEQGHGELIEPKYTHDFILLSDKELSTSDTISIWYVNNEEARVDGIIEFNPSEMSGNRYRISKTNGKIEKDGEKIQLKYEGTILASKDPPVLDHMSKNGPEQYAYAYNSQAR